MPRSRVVVLSWVVAVAFVLATALQLVDRFNIVATPPELPDSINVVDRILGSSQYRQAIWPVFLWTYLLFAIGFIATVVFAAAVASASRARRGLATFTALATTGGIIAAIASIIPLGAVNAAVWLGYCDCGFKETEVVSQLWAQMITQDIGDWLSRVASVVLGIALVTLARDAGAVISAALRTWTYLAAILLAAVPILITIDRFEPVPDLASLALGAVIIPVWAVWLGRSVDAVGAAETSS
jgi:hypothetical protein